ncbi:DMT family transporter [Paenibacillus physcomitrellae]|uniref:Multidrug transporter n=1 Tax=Paenibacillus physcomitrellae TaxID=1619311 RepID=A0ABQ1GRF4_9BACL|nr:DMT family transporter [Paenibacillus physcomitrellae]GGA48805.1 multidrug transporter [Paenibacillus physcomitrellae]
MKETKSVYVNAILLTIGVISIGLSSIFIKWSSAPASVLGMYRLLFTLVLITPMLRKLSLRAVLKELSRKEIVLLILSGIFLGLHFLLWMGSLAYTSVASSMILLSLQPVFIMVGSFFMFKERTTGGGVLALSVAVIGSAVTAWGDVGVSSKAMYGDVLSLLGAVASSLYMLTGQNLVRKIPPIAYSYIVFGVGGVVMLIYNLVQGVALFEYDSKEWLLFLLLAIVPTIFGQMLFNRLLGSLGATTISMVIVAEPAVAILLAAFLLNEQLTLLHGVGGVLTLLGIELFFWFKQMMIKRGQKSLR